jgi:hypothetical protein
LFEFPSSFFPLLVGCSIVPKMKIEIELGGDYVTEIVKKEANLL